MRRRKTATRPALLYTALFLILVAVISLSFIPAKSAAHAGAAAQSVAFSAPIASGAGPANVIRPAVMQESSECSGNSDCACTNPWCYSDSVGGPESCHPCPLGSQLGQSADGTAICAYNSGGSMPFSAGASGTCISGVPTASSTAAQSIAPAGTQCSAANPCPCTESWCVGGSCQACPQGFYPNGVGECESLSGGSYQGFTTSSGCTPSTAASTISNTGGSIGSGSVAANCHGTSDCYCSEPYCVQGNCYPCPAKYKWDSETSQCISLADGSIYSGTAPTGCMSGIVQTSSGESIGSGSVAANCASPADCFCSEPYCNSGNCYPCPPTYYWNSENSQCISISNGAVYSGAAPTNCKSTLPSTSGNSGGSIGSGSVAANSHGTSDCYCSSPYCVQGDCYPCPSTYYWDSPDAKCVSLADGSIYAGARPTDCMSGVPSTAATATQTTSSGGTQCSATNLCSQCTDSWCVSGECQPCPSGCYLSGAGGACLSYPSTPGASGVSKCALASSPASTCGSTSSGGTSSNGVAGGSTLIVSLPGSAGVVSIGAGSQAAQPSVKTTDATLTSPPAPAGLSKISAVTVSVTPNTSAPVSVTLPYPCSASSGDIAPYTVVNGAWSKIGSFTINPKACSVSFPISSGSQASGGSGTTSQASGSGASTGSGTASSGGASSNSGGFPSVTLPIQASSAVGARPLVPAIDAAPAAQGGASPNAGISLDSSSSSEGTSQTVGIFETSSGSCTNYCDGVGGSGASCTSIMSVDAQVVQISICHLYQTVTTAFDNPGSELAASGQAGPFDTSPANAVNDYNAQSALPLLTCPNAPEKNPTDASYFYSGAVPNVAGDACTPVPSSLKTGIDLQTDFSTMQMVAYSYSTSPLPIQVNGHLVEQPTTFYDYVSIEDAKVNPDMVVSNVGSLQLEDIAYSPMILDGSGGTISSAFATNSYVFDGVPASAQHAIWTWTAQFADLSNAAPDQQTVVLTDLRASYSWSPQAIHPSSSCSSVLYSCVYSYTLTAVTSLSGIANTYVPFNVVTPDGPKPVSSNVLPYFTFGASMPTPDGQPMSQSYDVFSPLNYYTPGNSIEMFPINTPGAFFVQRAVSPPFTSYLLSMPEGTVNNALAFGSALDAAYGSDPKLPPSLVSLSAANPGAGAANPFPANPISVTGTPEGYVFVLNSSCTGPYPCTPTYYLSILRPVDKGYYSIPGYQPNGVPQAAAGTDAAANALWAGNWKSYWENVMALQSNSIYVVNTLTLSTPGTLKVPEGTGLLSGYTKQLQSQEFGLGWGFVPLNISADSSGDVFITGSEGALLGLGGGFPAIVEVSNTLNPTQTQVTATPLDWSSSVGINALPEIAATSTGGLIFATGPKEGKIYAFAPSGDGISNAYDIDLAYSASTSVSGSGTVMLNVSYYLYHGGPYGVPMNGAVVNGVQTPNAIDGNNNLDAGRDFDTDLQHHPLGIQESGGFLYVLDDWRGYAGSRESCPLLGSCTFTGGMAFDMLSVRVLNSTGSNLPVDPTRFNDMWQSQSCDNPMFLGHTSGGLSAGDITPSAPTISSGQSVTLTANPSGGTPPYTYGWYVDPGCTSQIARAASSTYTTSPTGTDTFYYKVKDSAATPATVCSAGDTVTVSNGGGGSGIGAATCGGPILPPCPASGSASQSGGTASGTAPASQTPSAGSQPVQADVNTCYDTTKPPATSIPTCSPKECSLAMAGCDLPGGVVGTKFSCEDKSTGSGAYSTLATSQYASGTYPPYGWVLSADVVPWGGEGPADNAKEVTFCSSSGCSFNPGKMPGPDMYSGGYTPVGPELSVANAEIDSPAFSVNFNGTLDLLLNTPKPGIVSSLCSFFLGALCGKPPNPTAYSELLTADLNILNYTKILQGEPAYTCYTTDTNDQNYRAGGCNYLPELGDSAYTGPIYTFPNPLEYLERVGGAQTLSFAGQVSSSYPSGTSHEGCQSLITGGQGCTSNALYNPGPPALTIQQDPVGWGQPDVITGKAEAATDEVVIYFNNEVAMTGTGTASFTVSGNPAICTNPGSVTEQYTLPIENCPPPRAEPYSVNVVDLTTGQYNANALTVYPAPLLALQSSTVDVEQSGAGNSCTSDLITANALDNVGTVVISIAEPGGGEVASASGTGSAYYIIPGSAGLCDGLTAGTYTVTASVAGQSPVSQSLYVSTTTTQQALPAGLVATQALSTSVGGYVVVPYKYTYSLQQDWGGAAEVVSLSSTTQCDCKTGCRTPTVGADCPYNVVPDRQFSQQTVYSYALTSGTSDTLTATVESGDTYLKSLSSGTLYVPNMSDAGVVVPPQVLYVLMNNRLFGTLYVNDTGCKHNGASVWDCSGNPQYVLNATRQDKYAMNSYSQDGGGAGGSGSYETLQVLPEEEPEYGANLIAPSQLQQAVTTQNAIGFAYELTGGMDFVSIFDLYRQVAYSNPLYMYLNSTPFFENGLPVNAMGYHRLTYVMEDRFGNRIMAPMDVDVANPVTIALNVSTAVDQNNANQTALTINGVAGSYSDFGTVFTPLPGGPAGIPLLQQQPQLRRVQPHAQPARRRHLRLQPQRPDEAAVPPVRPDLHRKAGERRPDDFRDVVQLRKPGRVQPPAEQPAGQELDTVQRLREPRPPLGVHRRGAAAVLHARVRQRHGRVHVAARALRDRPDRRQRRVQRKHNSVREQAGRDNRAVLRMVTYAGADLRDAGAARALREQGQHAGLSGERGDNVQRAQLLLGSGAGHDDFHDRPLRAQLRRPWGSRVRNRHSGGAGDPGREEGGGG